MRYAYLTLSAALFLCGCGEPVPEGPNVLLVTFDTVRADHFGCYGDGKAETPNVDRLAKEGILFERCTSPVPITLPAHASILTGRYPNRHGVRDNGSYSLPEKEATLAEAFRDAGYDTAAFVSAYVLHSRYGLAQGFEVYDDTVRDSEAAAGMEERTAEATCDAALAWLARTRSRPFLLWVHFFDPHASYMPPSEWAARFPGDPYSGEIAFADSELGRLLGEMDLDRTLVVFAGDHGEGLGEHGEANHAYFVYDSTLRVPLVVRFPGGKGGGRRDRDQASLVDIGPTILDYLGIAGLEAADGKSLLGRGDGDAVAREVYFESLYPLSFGWAPLAGLRSAEWKYISSPAAELYRTSDDEDEEKNLESREPALAARFERKLAAMDPFAAVREETGGRRLSAEERQKLESLGYVGGGGGASQDLSALPDAKEMLPHFRKFVAAQALVHSGRFEKAEGLLRELLRDYPDMERAKLLLARALRDSGEPGEAIGLYEEALEKDPADPAIWYDLSVAYIKSGQAEKAVAHCGEGLKLHPGEPGLYDQLGLAYRMTGNLGEAIASGRRAVDIVKNRPQYLNNLGASYSAAGEYGRAIELFTGAIGIQPDFSEALFNLGVANLRAGDYRSAEASFREALRVDGSNTDAWMQLNKTLLYQERPDDALAVSDRLLEMAPGNPDARYFRSVAYRQKRDYVSAEGELRAFLAANPSFGPAYGELCKVLLAQSPPKREEAAMVAEEARARGLEIPADIAKTLGM